MMIKELNISKLADLCLIPENDVDIIVFTLVKTIGYFCKLDTHVIVDIRLPNEMYLLVSPNQFRIQTKNVIQNLFASINNGDDGTHDLTELDHKQKPSKQKRVISFIGKDSKKNYLNKGALDGIEPKNKEN